MSSNKKPEIKNTFDLAKSSIMKALESGKQPHVITSKEDMIKAASAMVKERLILGDFSYEPNTGEITIIDVLDVDLMKFDEQENKTMGVILRDFLQSEGWDGVSIIPARLGVKQTTLRLSHKALTTLELVQQGTRTERAMDSFLAKQ